MSRNSFIFILLIDLSEEKIFFTILEQIFKIFDAETVSNVFNFF